MRPALQYTAPAPVASVLRPTIQRKIRIGPVDDPLEREADRFADAVISGHSIGTIGGTSPDTAQRKYPACEKEEEKSLRRKSTEPAGSPRSHNGLADTAARAVSQGGAPLTPEQRAYFEPQFGRDLSGVRLHIGPAAEKSARELAAHAYTIGHNIAFAAGRFAPTTREGRHLLAHELTHVAQQSSSAADSRVQLKRDPETAEPVAAASPDEAQAEAVWGRNRRYFLYLVRAILKSKGSSIDEADEFALKNHLKSLSIQETKAFEKELLLWPKFGNIAKMTRLIEITTSFARRSDEEESRRGRFEVKEGGEIKDRLSDATAEFGFNECLNFLHNVSLDEFFSDEQARVDMATEEYAKGAAERRKKTITHGRTLSRLASELRLQGLLGPVNILRWRKGRRSAGHHEPHPAELFDRLSGAGPGWYFFLVSLISFHTFIIAVKVGSGSNRSYFEIQGGQSVPKSREELKAWFDDEFSNTTGAYSRVWQVYLQPKD